MSQETKRYLGDGVYADYDGYGVIVLTTEDGVQVQNRIYLEPIVWRELERYARDLWATDEAETER